MAINLTNTEYELANILFERNNRKNWIGCGDAAQIAVVAHNGGIPSDINPFFVDWNTVKALSPVRDFPLALSDINNILAGIRILEQYDEPDAAAFGITVSPQEEG